ncbi:MAG: tetratricopeptide repeat protein [Proteobacteria bacterium]|nr:tetratricopeptide repeat protein [Pseudomonadota bacterium]NDC23886.1 tetratricopeptide repeat protein [Pseudomonadota bacterium]NDD03286.1 tetratricopeptide repeat protein [Pseudomonadota bacterium]NDG25973.1 tetratricopeptide repeat protein [Pseudomonadota bacterium]
MSQDVVNLSYRRAKALIDDGLALVFQGQYEQARDNFKKSHGEHASADALTYWGWMEYQLGNIEKALILCKRAIKVDPDFGNPYNDIGSYLVVLGREDEALEWFQKAIEAKRYEARHYPHINLGRLFLNRNLPMRALQEFKKANDLFPNDATIQDAIRSITETLH